MTKLSFYGVGPKIGRLTLPYLAISIALTLIFPAIFTFGPAAEPYTLIAGAILLGAGLIFYFISVRLLLKGLKETRLVTTGTFRYSRNPLYAGLILGVIPAIALLMNSWAVLLTSVVAYLAFKRCIHGEYSEMESVFGEEYRSYCARTPEFFPWIG